MKVYMRSINYWYRFLAWLAALLIVGSSSACNANLIPVTGNTAGNTLTLSDCYQIRFLGLSKDAEKATTTWRYQVDELPCAAQELSDWMMVIPACASVIEASPASWEFLQPDPVLQSNGIKWKVPEEFQGGEFRVVLSGGLMRGSVLAGIKVPSEVVGLIQGPVCDPNAPAPTATFTSTTTSTTTSTIAVTATVSNTATSTLVPFVPTLAPTERTRPTLNSTSAAPLPTLTSLPNTPTSSLPNTATSAPLPTSTPAPSIPTSAPTSAPINTSPPEPTDTSAPDPTKTSNRPPTKTPKP